MTSSAACKSRRRPKAWTSPITAPGTLGSATSSSPVKSASGSVGQSVLNQVVLHELHNLVGVRIRRDFLVDFANRSLLVDDERIAGRQAIRAEGAECFR